MKLGRLSRRKRSDERKVKQQQLLGGANSSDALVLIVIVAVVSIIGGTRILEPQGSSSIWLSVQAAPIVTGAGGGLGGNRLAARHVRSLLREPMPWEDGYFDSSYHAWPKNRQQQVADSKSVKLTASEESVGGTNGGSSGKPA